MKAIWWYIGAYKLDISPVQGVKETEQQIVILQPAITGRQWGNRPETERRTFKHGGGDSYYPTFEQAKAALLGRIEHARQAAENSLAKAIAERDAVKGMEQPALDPAIWGEPEQAGR